MDHEIVEEKKKMKMCSVIHTRSSLVLLLSLATLITSFLFFWFYYMNEEAEYYTNTTLLFNTNPNPNSAETDPTTTTTDYTINQIIHKQKSPDHHLFDHLNLNLSLNPSSSSSSSGGESSSSPNFLNETKDPFEEEEIIAAASDQTSTVASQPQPDKLQLQGRKKGEASIESSNSNSTSAVLVSASSGEKKMKKKNKRKKSKRKKVSSNSICDVYNGNWVIAHDQDDHDYPLYTAGSCPFVDEGFNCYGNGRKDKDYMKWRWKPHNCQIPRFNGSNMLELLRGKRLVFVGDSLNRNQWESMLCLLSGSAINPKRIVEAHHRKITKEKGDYKFKFLDYGCNVEFYVTHFLVQEGKAKVGGKRTPTLRLDVMDRSSPRWKYADILVFNTAHWWSHYKTRKGKNFFQEGSEVHSHLNVYTAYRKAMNTWAEYIDRHIVPAKTQVFFRTSAPTHFSGGEWNSGGHCGGVTLPSETPSSDPDEDKRLEITQEVIKQMKTHVTLLDITAMSRLRHDGHPSIYYQKHVNYSAHAVQDCSHWCLPGVPDIWNELLYYLLQSKQRAIVSAL